MRTKTKKSKRSLSFLFMIMVMLLYALTGDSLGGQQVTMFGGMMDVSCVEDSMPNVLVVLWDIVSYSF